jgi:hypothetical protein
MTDWNEDNFVERLAPQLRKKEARAVSPCPDAETLLAVIEGAASEPERNAVNDHLSQCAACAELRSRLLNFESLSPPEPEAGWNQTETRLDNWLEGFLRSEPTHSHVPQSDQPPKRVFSWGSIANFFTPMKTAWRWGVALALVLIAIAPLVLEYQGELRPLVQAAVRTLIRPKPPNSEAGPAPADLNPPAETAEVRVPPATPAPPNLLTVQLYPDGRVATMRTIGMTVNYRFDGGRTIASEQKQRTLVSTGPHSGYVQRPVLSANGQTYSQRTYLVGNRTYTKLYRGFEYQGVRYYGYVPVRHFSPAFYEWAFNPWTPPIHYNWGWGSAPWFYGGYFAPAPYYPSATLWLTDYLIMGDLRAAYEAGLEADQPPAEHLTASPQGGPVANIQTMVSPGAKQVIANEVKQQLAAEQAEAANPPAELSGAQVPGALNPAGRVFVVSSNLSVVMVGGQECELKPVDVIARIDDTPGNDNKVRVIVMSSKQNDCSVGAITKLAVDDLQEMRNTFQEQLDSGLQMLAEKSGTGGLPNAPDTSAPNRQIPALPPDQGVADQLAALQVQADQAEYDAANRIQKSGDLKGALALFQALAEKAGPMQSQAQERAEQAAQLVENAMHSRGIVGQLAGPQTVGTQHSQGAAHSLMTTHGAAAGHGAAPATRRGQPATPSHGVVSKPAAPPKLPPPPPK